MGRPEQEPCADVAGEKTAAAMTSSSRGSYYDEHGQGGVTRWGSRRWEEKRNSHREG
jgi:hypothetical protein